MLSQAQSNEAQQFNRGEPVWTQDQRNEAPQVVSKSLFGPRLEVLKRISSVTRRITIFEVPSLTGWLCFRVPSLTLRETCPFHCPNSVPGADVRRGARRMVTVAALACAAVEVECGGVTEASAVGGRSSMEVRVHVRVLHLDAVGIPGKHQIICSGILTNLFRNICSKMFRLFSKPFRTIQKRISEGYGSQ